jgi:hypothetical protein
VAFAASEVLKTKEGMEFSPQNAIFILIRLQNAAWFDELRCSNENM